MAQPSAAIRLDIDAMWISATSSADAADPVAPRLRRPGVDDPAEQRVVGVAAESTRRTAVSTTATTSSSATFGALVRRGDRGHRVGVHERVRAVQRVERRHQPFERVTVSRSRSRP